MKLSWKLQQFCETRYLFPIVLLLLGIALSIPAILSGYNSDDYIFISPLLNFDGPFEYYRFIPKCAAGGWNPWWASEDYGLSLFRPLSSATLYLDFHYWIDFPLFAHLHTVLWFIALLVGAFSILRQCLDGKSAPLAMAIFTLSTCHTLSVGWIAARHTLVGGAFAVWSASLYLRWRDTGSKSYAFVSLALFVLGLLSSEVAVALAAFVISYELFRSFDSARDRVRAAIPTLVIAVVYLVFYKMGGYGAIDSSLYLDPFVQPGAYLSSILPRSLALFGAMMFGFPASIVFIDDYSNLAMLVGAIALSFLLIGCLMYRTLLESVQWRRLKWLALMGILGMLPGLAGIVEGRAVIFSVMAFSAILGMLIGGLWSSRRSGFNRVLSITVVSIMCLGVFILSPLSRLLLSVGQKVSSEDLAAIGSTELECIENRHVYVVNVYNLSSPIYYPFSVAYRQGPTFRSWQHLVEAHSDVEVERTGPDTIVIKSESGPLINAFTYKLFRKDSDKLDNSTVIDRDNLKVVVLDASSEGPTKAAFTIRGLDSPGQVCVLAFDDRNRLKEMKLPDIGSSVVLTWSAW